ncbi:GSCOCG00004035001-RA-CDS [Cotesia congregata]|nr:GSCOCG00004035001-RA-CDS [Cotesia congregata]
MMDSNVSSPSSCPCSKDTERSTSIRQDKAVEQKDEFWYSVLFLLLWKYLRDNEDSLISLYLVQRLIAG